MPLETLHLQEKTLKNPLFERRRQVSDMLNSVSIIKARDAILFVLALPLRPKSGFYSVFSCRVSRLVDFMVLRYIRAQGPSLSSI